MRASVMRRRDRWADWLVIAVVVLALGGGVGLREVVLFGTQPFSLDQAGISGKVPANWMIQKKDDPLLQARDPRGGEFDTRLELRTRGVAPEADLALALESLALDRAGEVVAYQTLDTQQVVVRGEDAVRRTFTYVHVNTNPYVDQLPVVVKGVDVVFRDGDRAIVVTLLAGRDVFDRQQVRLQSLIESLDY